MGVGAENDAGGGADFDDGPDALVYRFWWSDSGTHKACPYTVTKSQWVDILDAATSLSALVSYLNQNHSSMHGWFTSQPSAVQGKMRLAALGNRGL